MSATLSPYARSTTVRIGTGSESTFGTRSTSPPGAEALMPSSRSPSPINVVTRDASTAPSADRAAHAAEERDARAGSTHLGDRAREPTAMVARGRGRAGHGVAKASGVARMSEVTWSRWSRGWRSRSWRGRVRAGGVRWPGEIADGDGRAVIRPRSGGAPKVSGQSRPHGRAPRAARAGPHAADSHGAVGVVGRADPGAHR
jgi:hypothetical protein